MSVDTSHGSAMYLAVFSVFAASKKEPFADALKRIHDAFVGAGLGEPLVRFHLTDPPAAAGNLATSLGIKRVSSIARVLKRYPALGKFVHRGPQQPDGTFTIRGLSNLSQAGVVEPVAFSTLMGFAEGVPRSFPFHKAQFHFSAPGFSDGPDVPQFQDPKMLGMLMRAGVDIGAGHPTTPGISVQDAWWANGRLRDVAALRIIETELVAKKLPAPPAHIAGLLAACGKVRKTLQLPVHVGDPHADTQQQTLPDLKSTETGQALLAILRAHRARLRELVETLPHDVPPTVEPEAALNPLGIVSSGPKKPELERCFKALGYSCRGESGSFTLRRRTPGNLTVELRIDVGTWSDKLVASFAVAGMIDGQGFKVRMSLPPSRHASRGDVNGVEMVGQFPIGGPERWRQLVENLAAMTARLDEGFVPEIESTAGPSPEWYQLDST
jgi:hypothetical protein